MGDFTNFLKLLENGDLEEVISNFRMEFVNKAGNDQKCFPIHIACKKGFFNIAKFLLQNNCNIECVDKLKCKPIHFACENGHADIVKLLFQHNCNIECENNKRWKPIHFACWKGHVEIVKLLIQHNCQIDCKTKQGQTPLDMAKKKNQTSCIDLLSSVGNLLAAIKQNDVRQFKIVYSSCNSIKMDLYIRLRILQTALENSCHFIIQRILNKPLIDKEINFNELIKECYLFRCIINQNAGRFKELCTVDVINKHDRIIGSSYLEIATEHGCRIFIDEIMKKTIYNKSTWVQAINIAKKNGFMGIAEEISERMNLLESKQMENFTILHSAICDNNDEMVNYILDHPNLIDINANNKTFGTALALAHSLHHRKCIRILQQYQLDTNTQNKYSQTPLHEAIASCDEKECEFLIPKVINIDQTGYMGLTSLHCAVIRGMVNICTKLMIKGADCLKFVKFSRQASNNEIVIPFEKPKLPLSHSENALTLSMKFNGTLFQCFHDRLNSNNSNIHDGDNNTLLHMAVKCLQPVICKLLLDAKADANNINKNGDTPLLELLNRSYSDLNIYNINKMIEITNLLIEFRADVNVQSSKGITVFQAASFMYSEKLMLALISNNPKLINFSTNNFKLAYNNQWFTYTELLIELLPDDFLLSNITKDTFQKCEKADLKLIKLLFEKSSFDLQQSILENLLYDAVNNSNYELFKHFINIKILVPKLFETGENLFSFIIKKKKIYFAWELLESLNKIKFINLKNKDNQIPLQVAIEIEKMDLINVLVHESSDLNYESPNGKTVLTQFLEKISNTTKTHIKRKMILATKSTILLGGDIYKLTYNGQRVIDACLDSNIKAEIEGFYEKNIKKSNQRNINNEKICTICLDNVVNMVFQCGHFFCRICAEQVSVCPLCKTEIINRIAIYNLF